MPERKVIGKYGARNKRLANGDRTTDPLFAPVAIKFCPKCKRVEKFCTCEVSDAVPK